MTLFAVIKSNDAQIPDWSVFTNFSRICPDGMALQKLEGPMAEEIIQKMKTLTDQMLRNSSHQHQLWLSNLERTCPDLMFQLASESFWEIPPEEKASISTQQGVTPQATSQPTPQSTPRMSRSVSPKPQPTPPEPEYMDIITEEEEVSTQEQESTSELAPQPDPQPLSAAETLPPKTPEPKPQIMPSVPLTDAISP